MRLRTHLVMLTLAALLPVLAFAGTMVVLFAKEQRYLVEGRLQETTRALAVAVDRELASGVAALQALATSHHLETGDLAQFRMQASLVLRSQGGWSAVSLFDEQGRLAISTKPRLPGAQLHVADRAWFQAILASGQPAVSGYFPSRVNGDPSFAVGVPVRVAGRLRYVLAAGIRPEVVVAILAEQRLAPGWQGSIVDAEGVVLARTRAENRFVGRPAPVEYTERSRRAEEGVLRTVTPAGVAVYSVFSRVPLSGWTVALVVPATLVDGPVQRSVLAVTAGGAALVAFGLVLVLVFGRRIARPLATLVASTPTIARGEPFPTVADDIAEVDELARALHDASDARRASEVALRASEQRLAAQHAVTQILADAGALDDAAPRLLGALCHALDADAGEIWRVDESGCLRCVDALPGGGLETFAATARELVIARGAGLLGRVWSTGKSLWISDLSQERETARAGARPAGIRAAVAVPIMHADVVGVAAFYARRAREPDPDLLEMLASVGSQVGQFVERRRAEQERARLFAVTERALRDVEASERRYRLFVEALPHLGWTLRSDSTPDYMNREWFEYTGLTPAQSDGDGWLSVVHPDDLEATLGCWREALARGEGVAVENRLRRRDGFYRWFLMRLEPIRDGAGAVVLWLATAVDIDNQKRAELGAVHANRAKDTFLATLAHELRTPLTAMLGWLHVLRAGRPGAATMARGLETIERNVRLQSQIVDDLLDVSRVVAGKLDLRVVPVDLGRLLEQAVDTVRPSAQAKGVRLDLTLDDGARRSAGDPDRLQQVLGNLLTNAVKFTDHGGRIDVRLERRGGRARISVRDTGKGIDPVLLPHVFDWFRQGAERTPERPAGLGLGLAIVKRLVELHGGTVYAESQGEGRGATVVVQLALAEDGPEA